MKNTLKPAPDFFRQILPLKLGAGKFVMVGHSESMEVADEHFYRSLSLYDEEYVSCGVVVVGNTTTQDYVLVGALTAFRSLTHFITRLRGAVPDSIEVRQEDIPADESLPPEELAVLRGNDWRVLLRQYAALAAAKNNVPPIHPASNLTGYCSWYYYYDTVSESDFRENIGYMHEAVKNGSYPAQVIQIDDGYQSFQGDWLHQGKTWKTPLKDVAADIAAKEMIPGIWLMPFLASTASRTFREHPEWFVKDSDTGEPGVINGWSLPPNHLWACLDTTNPNAIQHIQNVFRTFHDWGFRYFKLDGLGFALKKGRRQNADATPVSAYREGMKAIREAVPDDFILGCNVPYTPSLGFCNGARVSRDVNAEWPFVFNAWKETIARFWMFDTWYRCDPDVLVVREELGTLTPGEARFSALCGILTGVSMTSDKLPMLSPERLALLTKASHLRLNDAIPADWPPDSWPEIITGTVNGKHAAAVFNWHDTHRDYSRAQMGFSETARLKDAMGAARVVWQQLSLPPHDAALVLEP